MPPPIADPRQFIRIWKTSPGFSGEYCLPAPNPTPPTADWASWRKIVNNRWDEKRKKRLLYDQDPHLKIPASLAVDQQLQHVLVGALVAVVVDQTLDKDQDLLGVALD